MNVIIANKNRAILDQLNIDVIKKIEGEFDADSIVENFKNFFYQRMILDITAIKGYKDIRNLQKLSVSLDTDKIILLLDDSVETSDPSYLSKLISIGIYNFTKNLDGIMYLYNTPNTYRDVAYIHQIEPVVQPQVQQQHMSYGTAAPVQNVAQNSTGMGRRIIGIKNVTKQSGSTTLTYMMYNRLSKFYDTAAVEVGKADFKFFNNQNLKTADSNNVSDFIIKNGNKEIILVDANEDQHALELCTDVIYLLEPSVIKLNKMMMIHPDLLNKLKNEKVVLNQSLLTHKDVLDFERESGLKIYYNMPPLDERSSNSRDLDAFLMSLGFNRINASI